MVNGLEMKRSSSKLEGGFDQDIRKRGLRAGQGEGQLVNI